MNDYHFLTLSGSKIIISETPGSKSELMVCGHLKKYIFIIYLFYHLV